MIMKETKAVEGCEFAGDSQLANGRRAMKKDELHLIHSALPKESKLANSIVSESIDRSVARFAA